MSRQTRLALAEPHVRRGLWWAWLGGGLVWCAVVKGPPAVAEAVGLSGPVIPAVLGGLALGAGLVAHRWHASPVAGVLAALGPLVVSGFAPTPAAIASSLFLSGVAGGWVVGAVARQAKVSRAGSAAAGLTLIAAAGGLLLIPLSSLWLAAVATFVVASGRPRPPDRPAGMGPPEPASDRGALLAADALSFSFGDRPVLDGLSVALRAGELVALVGGNGTGKSTLLRLLSGHLLPDRGALSLSGDDVLGALPEELARWGVTLASGSRPVFPDLTVAENLRLATWISEGDRRSRRDAAGAALARFPELRGRERAAAGTLSGGEQRLVALAASVATRPHVLLVDEVTLGLSPATRARALQMLRATADAGAAVLVVDHEVRDVLPLADRVLVLDHGVATETDDPGASPARFMPDAVR